MLLLPILRAGKVGLTESEFTESSLIDVPLDHDLRRVSLLQTQSVLSTPEL